MILKNIKLKNKLTKLISADHLLDVFVFGSTIRGSQKPNDLDILLLFTKKVDIKIELNVRNILRVFYSNISIVSKTEKTILDPSFDARESILFEATSLIDGANLAEKYGFKSFGMFKYSFKDWNKLTKTKFYYALNGRSGKTGIFQNLDCIKLSDQIILVPLDKIELFRDFLKSWNLEHKYIPLLLPARLGRKKILE